MNNDWIKTSDQLPRVDQDVWYFFEFVGVFPGKYFGLIKIDESNPDLKETYFGGPHGNLVGDVTHWLPRDKNDNKPTAPILEE